MENPVACRLESCHLGHLMIKACAYCDDLCSSEQLSLCGSCRLSWRAQREGGDVASGTWHVMRHGERCHNLQMLRFVKSSTMA